MKHYDPDVAPDHEKWLALDERKRIRLVEDQHRQARVRLPNLTLHATVHAVVENQIAEGVEPVLRAMDRLRKQGLTRHEALHAVGTVVAEFLYDAFQTEDRDSVDTFQSRFDAAVERLTAESWRRDYGDG